MAWNADLREIGGKLLQMRAPFLLWHVLRTVKDVEVISLMAVARFCYCKKNKRTIDLPAGFYGCLPTPTTTAEEYSRTAGRA